jgi:hypothetical protein
MDPLREFGLQRDWIYEVVVSAYCDRRPHAAPIGVWTTDFKTLEMEVFSDSLTLAGVLETMCFAVNFPADACVLRTVLYAPHELTFERARDIDAPLLSGSPATVEVTVDRTSASSDRVRVMGTVLRAEARPELRPINRAEGLVLESLILATRLPYLDGASTMARLRENGRVVHKVAPGSSFDDAMMSILHAHDLDA